MIPSIDDKHGGRNDNQGVPLMSPGYSLSAGAVDGDEGPDELQVESAQIWRGVDLR